MCPYAYYEQKNNSIRELIYCKKTNDICVYSRYCNKLNKIIPSEGMGDCVMNKKERIPKGASEVRKTISNLNEIYVDIVEKDGNTYTHVLKNPYDYIPDYVYVIDGIAGYEVDA